MKKLVDVFNSISIRNRFILSYLFIALLFAIAFVIISYDSISGFILNRHDIKSYNSEYITKLLFFGLAIIIIALILSVIASNYFNSKFNRIIALLKLYSDGNLEVREEVNSNDELGYIFRALNSMADSLVKSHNTITGAKDRIKDLYDNAPSMFCVMDLNGVIFDVNLTLSNNLLGTKASFIGRNFLELVSDDTKEVFGNSFIEFIFSSNEDQNIEFKLNVVENKKIYVSMTWNLITNNSEYYFNTEAYHKGKPIFGIRSVVNDITKEKEAEIRKSTLLDSMNNIPMLLGDVIAGEEVFVYILIELSKVVDYKFGCLLFAPDEEYGGYRIAADFNPNTQDCNKLVGEGFNPKSKELEYIIESKDSHVFDGLCFEGSGGKSFIISLFISGELYGIMIIDKVSDFNSEELDFCKAFASLMSGSIHDLILKERLQVSAIEVKQTLKELEDKNLILQKEIDMAVFVQQGILPPKDYYFNGIHIVSYYEAMAKVGGDFYDFFHIPNGQLVILIADVSGHGIPAALVTTMAKTIFNRAANNSSSPKEIMKEANLEICANVKTDDYLSAFIIVIDKKFNLSYSNAGHQAALLYRKHENRLEKLDTPGFFLGIMDEADSSYEEKSIKFGYGDRLLLYTDGVVESVNDNNEQFAIERLEDIFSENQNMAVDDLREIILGQLADFTNNKEPNDDISLVIVELAEEYEQVVDAIYWGNANFHVKNYEDSLKYFYRAIDIDHQNLDVIICIAESHFRLGQYDKSIEFYERYIGVKKSNPMVYFHLGLSYFKIANYDKAIESGLNALNIDKTFIRAYHLLGLVYKKLKDYDEAKKYFLELLKIDPDNKKAKNEFHHLSSLINNK